ncbi:MULTISPECIES: iron-siderophore ABC transporter substrate-binding protein [unclassified Paenibacillus]|uniref:ABC transporter substrate-binding protein n=1 Tax=unclassified Paenibacillus TaxID=185978 RepID=UPI000956C805|nr:MULTISPECIES: iron-siderophore ABC transporter substrate-binding protein [unclassified Paenibacillus]ASS67132.1 iron-siderophore ABC transporter substrate-binding protein [Paenibacillus sp. RUD330]SIQ88940.1 iron complex transport system substrate-binding protein [Paenibacillus sp. RU4X]SIR09856.1 iron complex transport system substrate-binding protein [Paenibacillus sp. RU4T]
MNKRIAAFMVSILLIGLLAACGSNNNNTASGPAANQPAANIGESSSSGDAERIVKHALGETKIKGTPQKVVVLTNEGTEAVLALGVKPVGAVKSWTGDPWYAHIKDKMEGVTVLGEESQPNIELIAGLQPDLIIANKMRHEKIFEQLSAIAPTVEAQDLRGYWKENFTLYADALNKKAEGEKLIADFDARIEDFKAKAGSKLNETVSMVRFMGGKTRVYHTDTFSGIIFDQIGIARNAMTKNSKETFVDEITKERLPEVEADRLFYFTYDTGDGKGNATEQEWTGDPLWKSLKVVQEGRAKRVDDAIWNTAGGILAANLMLDELYQIYEV